MQLQDENGNKVQMNSDGITLQSGGNLTLNAKGDVNIKGTNIKNSAKTKLKATGNSGAELSTSGMAVVKGSIVQIN